jgi:hypothetical protein
MVVIVTRTRALLLAPVLALGLALTAPAVGASTSEAGGYSLLRQIGELRAETWRWQRVMGRPLVRTLHSERVTTSPAYRVWLRDLWRARAERARRQAHHPPHGPAWRCIHRHEGSWRDPGAPYYGGLQMDIAFQRAYGRRLLRRKGTANRWTPLEQIWVAEKALRAGRGFYPWPTAARRCGLL